MTSVTAVSRAAAALASAPIFSLCLGGLLGRRDVDPLNRDQPAATEAIKPRPIAAGDGHRGDPLGAFGGNVELVGKTGPLHDLAFRHGKTDAALQGRKRTLPLKRLSRCIWRIRRKAVGHGSRAAGASAISRDKIVGTDGACGARS